MGSSEITFEIVTSAIVDMEKLKDPQEAWTAIDNGKGGTLWMPYKEAILYRDICKKHEEESIKRVAEAIWK